MTLESNLTAFAQAVGRDIKARAIVNVSGPYVLDPKRTPAGQVTLVPPGTVVLAHLGNRFTGTTAGQTPSQASTARSGSDGDPNGTTAVSKRRRICAAADTSPLGTADTTRAPQADPAAAASAAISTPPSRPRHRRPPGRSVSCRCPPTRFLLHAGPSPRVVQSRSGSSRPANLSAGPASPPWCATSRSWCANRRASRRTGRDHG